jgi:hypothetical protein
VNLIADRAPAPHDDSTTPFDRSDGGVVLAAVSEAEVELTARCPMKIAGRPPPSWHGVDEAPDRVHAIVSRRS